MTKILFTDMDGTLLLNDSTVSAEMKEALNRLIAAGHKLVLSSGRPLDSMLKVMERAGLFYPGTLAIAYNGSLVYDCINRVPLMEHTVPMEIAADILAASKRHGIHAQVYTEHEVVCEAKTPEVLSYCRKVELPMIIADDPLSVLSRPSYKVLSIHLTDKSRLEALKTEIDARYSDVISAQFSNDQYLEFYSVNAGKGNAILWVCNHFGIPAANSFAAGDAPNDLSMLAAAGTGIAMANADAEVKKAADVVTALDNQHNGLIEIIDQYFI